MIKSNSIDLTQLNERLIIVNSKHKSVNSLDNS
jgi:hypothetical protein